jgi:hypothetical protein
VYNLGVTAYNDADYLTARIEAQSALWNPSKLNVIQKCKFLELLGSSFVALEKWEDADSAFWDILELDPKWQLQLSLYPSPKIEEIFNDIRLQHQAFLRRPDSERLSAEQLRFNASWRSLVLPGWGQYYKGQKARGAVVTSLQILSLAALVVLQSEVNRRHDIYEEKEGSEAITAYDEYTRVWRARNVAGYVAVGIYVGAYLDALYTKVHR